MTSSPTDPESTALDCSCGHRSATGDLFCSQCGRWLAAQAPNHPLFLGATAGPGDAGNATDDAVAVSTLADGAVHASDDASTLLVDPLAPDRSNASVQVSNGGAGRRGLLFVAGLALIGFAVYGLVTTADDGVVEPDPDEAALDETEEGPEPTLTAEDAPTTDAPITVATATAESSEETAAGSTATTAGHSSNHSVRRALNEEPVDAPGRFVVEPPLPDDFPSNLFLLEPHGSGSTRVDLVSGTNDFVPLLGEPDWSRPVVTDGRRFLLRRQEALFVADLANPENPVRLTEGFDGQVMAVDFVDNRAYLFTFGDRFGRELDAVDLDTGEVVETIDLPPFALSNGVGNGLGASPLIVAGGGHPLLLNADGRIFARSGSGFRSVAVGQIVVATEEALLLTSCDDALRCPFNWIDRVTFQPLDLAVPPDVADKIPVADIGRGWIGLVDPFDHQDTTVWVHEVATGRRVEVAGSAVYPSDFSITKDGQWLVAVDAPSNGGSGFLIQNLETRQEHRVIVAKDQRELLDAAPFFVDR